MSTFATVTDNELEGIVLIVPSDVGGKTAAVKSGYRGQFFWHVAGHNNADWDAEFYFEGDHLKPGETGRVKVKLLGNLIGLGRTTGMPKGRQFCLREGSRVVAVGVISNSKYDFGGPSGSLSHRLRTNETP